MGDGIAVLGEFCTTRSAPRRPAGAFGAPASRLPPYGALRQCLRLQSEGPSLSTFSRVFGVDPLVRSAQRAYRGALAEIQVARVLAALGDGWTVLHSVPGDEGSVIDHLAIGPAGVFAIGTLNHAGQRIWVGERTFMADDERLDCLARAEVVAAAISRRLSGARDNVLPSGTVFSAGPDGLVTACIVIDAPSELVIRQRPGRTEVVTARSFGGWFADLPRLLSPAVVAQLSTAALTTDTRSESDLPGDTAAMLHDFDLLQRTVSASHLRRLIWTALGLVLCYAAVFGSLGGLSLVGLSALLRQ